MANYTTFQTVSRFLQGASEADTQALNLSIAAASRLFDRLSEVTDGFFTKAEVAPSEKVLAGNGISLLRLPPFVEGSLTVIENYDLTQFKSVGKPPLQYLICPPNGIFSEFENYKLTARWGFAEIPADVEQATVALAIKIFRETDAATVRMTDTENQYTTQNVPPFVKAICESYRKMNLFFAQV